jgi:soluble lytic murein transglycosylase-like protein
MHGDDDERIVLTMFSTQGMQRTSRGELSMRARIAFVSVVSTVLMLVAAAPVHAELAFFVSGRSVSIKAHRIDGESLVLTLRSGGEIVCAPSVIARFAPDEVPYPEPEAAGEPVAPTIAAAPADQRYREIIDNAAAAQGVDPKLVRAVIQVESAYQQRARSRKGAMGLMQLMPETARHYGVTDPYDPRSNIEAGIKHLKSLLDRFELPLALAAYNAGEAAVLRFGGIPPFPETQNYVRRVLSSLLP